MARLAARFIKALVIVCLMLAAVPAPAAHASTITVTNLNDSGSGSLRQAIIDAGSGDTINFSVTGTINLSSGQLLFDKNLTILGPGEGSLTIDAGNHSR